MPASLLPATTNHLRIPVDGGQLAAVAVDADAGVRREPVLLVPGYTGSKEDFRLVLAPLAQAGHRTVAIDQRGQYQSPGPDDPSSYTVEALATDLLAVLGTTGPAHLVGHSFGGLVARAAVLRQPAAVRSLTLLSSGPAALTGPRTDALVFLRPLLEQGGLPAVVAALDALEQANPSSMPVAAELREFLRARMLACSATGLLAMAEALIGEPDRVDELRDTGVPLLVLHGAADDAWTPQAQHEMAERLASSYVVIPDALHSPAVEQPDATVAALLAFFAQVEDEL